MRYTCNTCGAVYAEPHERCPNCGEELIANKVYKEPNQNYQYNNHNINQYQKSKDRSYGKTVLIMILSLGAMFVLTIIVILSIIFLNFTLIDTPNIDTEYEYEEDWEDYELEETYAENEYTFEVTDYETPYYMIDYKTGEYDFFDSIVTGTLVWGNLEGEGKVVNLEEGYTYEGEFFSGSFDGIGKITYDNGEILHAQFRYGLIEENLNTALLTIYQDEDIELSYDTQIFLEVNGEELKDTNGLPEYYYDTERVSLKELNSNPDKYTGECISLPELKIMEVSNREVYKGGYSVTEITALDKQDNVYRMVTAVEKTGLNVGDTIKTDVMFISPVQIYGAVDANLFVILRYETR